MLNIFCKIKAQQDDTPSRSVKHPTHVCLSPLFVICFMKNLNTMSLIILCEQCLCLLSSSFQLLEFGFCK